MFGNIFIYITVIYYGCCKKELKIYALKEIEGHENVNNGGEIQE